MDRMYMTPWDSPLGVLTLVSDGTHLVYLHLPHYKGAPPDTSGYIHDPAPLKDVGQQLDEYFAGQRRDFDIDVAPIGTPFQQQVWSALRTIPYGATVSYCDVATQIGNPKAVRAVGLANGRNPVPIVVPCHRVVGANGSLTGYGGGLEAKQVLLDLEWTTANRADTESVAPKR